VQADGGRVVGKLGSCCRLSSAYLVDRRGWAVIRRRLNLIEFSLRLVTLLLPLLAFGVAAYVRFVSGLLPVAGAGINPADYFGLLFLAILVWAIVLEWYGFSRVDELFPAHKATWRAFWASAVAYMAVTGATFFYRSASFSRLFVVFSASALFLLMLATQQGFRMLLRRVRRKGNKYSRILVIGADEFAQRAARSLCDALVMPGSVVGFVCLPGQEPAGTATPAIELDTLRESGVRPDIDDIIIAVPPSRLAEIPGLVAKLEFLCVPVRAVLELGRGVVTRDAIFHAGDVTLLDLRVNPSESVAYAIVKRAFDLVFATTVIIITAPLMALVAVAIRLTSRGPIFFVQERVGLNGVSFRMYKFRTMRVGEAAESEIRWTVPGDPRRTKLGLFLRRSSLDEFPQFFNVLKGDMSVVGPRPERPHFVKKFLQDVAQYNTRHYLKVGITGWAQVNGWRGDTSIAKRVEYDLHYLDHWSLWFDLKIIFLTVWRGFFAKNAY